MDLRDPGLIDVPEGIFYGQNERIDELNWRINDRMESNAPMKPNYDPRPVPTKYAHFPIIDRVKPITEPNRMYLDYDVETWFAPCTSKPHFNGFSRNIDKESTLRSQDRILQKYETKNEYTPSFESDMYKVGVPQRRLSLFDQKDAHPDLFKRYNYNTPQFDNAIGSEKFNNATRTQLRNME
jgi:hypothetical protein